MVSACIRILLLATLMGPLAKGGGTETREVFDLTAYSQDLDVYLPPEDPSYDRPVISAEVQAERAEELRQHHCGSLSPWSATFVAYVIGQPAPDDVYTRVSHPVGTFRNGDKPSAKTGYGPNYRPLSAAWATGLAEAMNLPQFEKPGPFDPRRRAIAVTNLPSRLLPTDDPHFYSHTLPGEGYPFDNLQDSAIWVGTPLYVMGESRDGRWSLVLSPDVLGWVKSEGVARVSEGFVQSWQGQIRRHLLAITRPDSPVRSRSGQALVTGYTGTLLPALAGKAHPIRGWEVWLPVRDTAGRASRALARIPADRGERVPLAATPRNMAGIVKGLLGRPYGWGNLTFYNDCSAEMKALFAPLGIYLPRNSGSQSGAGRVVDLSDRTPEQRTAYLLAHGRPLTTTVYIGGHIMLYLGPTSVAGQEVPMTYQNIWGLTPPDRSKRSILGGSVLIPVLPVYPEDPSLVSLAARRSFVVAFLDEIPPK